MTPAATATLAIIAAAAVLLAAALAVYWVLRQRSIDIWIVPYVRDARRRRVPVAGEPVHMLIAITDHYEPRFGNAPDDRARSRVRSWVEQYPRQFGNFRDSDGRPPRHSFFYPLEKYEPDLVDELGALCRGGYGEVEVHLHHHGDTSEVLRQRLIEYRDALVNRHGQLSRHRHTGAVGYGFIHGDWALDNSSPDGCNCGVNNELDILRETGCYADFTLPSAPVRAQTRTINSIYYAVDDPARPKSHDTGVPVAAGRTPPPNSLMIIQGPLLLDWAQRKLGVMPRLENAYLQLNQPPMPHRPDLWLKARVQVPSRPDWFFVKLHCHGATEWHQKVMLGEPMVRLHKQLAERAKDDPNFHYHYVTAREMYNLAKAAEAGWTGSVADALDYELIWNGGNSSAPQRTDPISSANVLR